MAKQKRSLYWRLIILLAIASVFAGFVIWLVESLRELYSAVPPVLGWILLAILAVMLIGFMGVAIYYLFLINRNPTVNPALNLPPPPPPPQSTAAKTKATQANLKGTETYLAHLQDEVARAALAAQAEAIQRNMEAQRLRVVVFGTGSAGKTSLINALMGRDVGEVGATLGTTQTAALYRWTVPGISQPVDLVDSPGILEVGGESREAEAKQQAQAADLLLFVVDADLRQSEATPLKELARLGKRSLLVLNKADRYTPAEQDTLLARLRQRVEGVIAYEDVILASAKPAPITTAAGQTLQPTPKIKPLRDRIHAILIAEGRLLYLDNALLQSEQLQSAAKAAYARQLEAAAERIIQRYQWVVAAAVFANPLPAVDLLATAAINAQMVVEIGGIYGCQLNLQRGRELAFSLAKTLAGMGLIEGSIQVITEVVAALLEFTIVGFLVTGPIQAASAGYLTRVAGRSFIEYFKQDQNWGTGGMEAVLQTQMQRAKQDPWLHPFLREFSRRFLKPPPS